MKNIEYMKTIIITGVSEGLGYNLAKLCIENSIKVIGISRNKPNDLDIIHISEDLTKIEDVNYVTQEIISKYSNFDAIVNCAGELNIEDLDKINHEKLDHLLSLNVQAPILLISKLLDAIKKNEADILNIGSTIGYKAYEKQIAYGASKWAMRGLTENLRIELKGTKSRIILFNPGGFKSKIFEKASGHEIDLSPFMEPKELAKLIFYILNMPKNMEVSEIIINRK